MQPDDEEDAAAASEDDAEIVEIPLEEAIDLHGFLPQDVAAIVRDYLNDAYAAGFAEVRIIHGRGIGALREMVRNLLSQDSRIARFKDAPFDRGGNGATVAHFRR
jgi:dsDNA-specific endonuclease/ATPase MutS2